VQIPQNCIGFSVSVTPLLLSTGVGVEVVVMVTRRGILDAPLGGGKLGVVLEDVEVVLVVVSGVSTVEKVEFATSQLKSITHRHLFSWSVSH